MKKNNSNATAQVKNNNKKSEKGGANSQDGGLAAQVGGTRYNNLIPQLSQNPFKLTFSTFGDTRTALIDQKPDFGIGGVLWDCEYVICMYLLHASNRGLCPGRSFLELGAGTGLAAVVAWLLGGVAIATDLPDVVTAATIPNVTLNQNHSCASSSSAMGKRRQQIAAANLSWGNADEARETQVLLAKMSKGVLPAYTAPVSPAATPVPTGDVVKCTPASGSTTSTSTTSSQSSSNAAAGRPFDVILAADCIYHSEHHEPLLQTMATVMHAQTKLIFVLRRRFENDTDFLDPLMGMFDVVKATPVRELVPDYPKDILVVYEFMPKARRE